MTVKNATLASGEMLNTGYLRGPVKVLLEARDEGLGEAMLVHLVRVTDMDSLGQAAAAYCVNDDDSWTDKVRKTCRLLGAVKDEQGVWRLPSAGRAAA